jgi:hypothetical protein
MAIAKTIKFGDYLNVTDEVAGDSGGRLPAPGGTGIGIEGAYKIPGAGLKYWYRLGELGPWPTAAPGTAPLVVANFAHDSSGTAIT